MSSLPRSRNTRDGRVLTVRGARGCLAHRKRADPQHLSCSPPGSSPTRRMPWRGSVAPGGRRSVPAPRTLSRATSPRYHRGVWPPGVRAPVPSTHVRSFEGREDTPAAQRGLTDDEPREPVRAPRLTPAVPAAYGRRAVSAPPGGRLASAYRLRLRVALALPKGRWPWELFNGGLSADLLPLLFPAALFTKGAF